jgi:hypothetical protein
VIRELTLPVVDILYDVPGFPGDPVPILDRPNHEGPCRHDPGAKFQRTLFSISQTRKNRRKKCNNFNASSAQKKCFVWGTSLICAPCIFFYNVLRYIFCLNPVSYITVINIEITRCLSDPISPDIADNICDRCFITLEFLLKP